MFKRILVCGTGVGIVAVAIQARAAEADLAVYKVILGAPARHTVKSPDILSAGYLLRGHLLQGCRICCRDRCFTNLACQSLLKVTAYC